jgi:hypothetical protein
LLILRPIAYVKRPVPVDDDNNIISQNILEPAAFNPGARLYIRETDSPSADERIITDSAFGSGALYDVKDVEVSYDGTRLLFSMRAPTPEDDDDPEPTWNIWEYNTITNTLERLISEDTVAERGHDISPNYLPDGRIIFSSTRQEISKAILLQEGKEGYTAVVDDNEPIFNIHILNPINDGIGSRIDQLTFNQGHDIEPTILSDGRIAFLRYDAVGNLDNLSLYTINSDGSNLQSLYGYNSQQTGNTNDADTTFVDFRELSDGTLLSILQERDSDIFGGDIIRINTNGFVDIDQPTYDNRGDTGSGQRSLTFDPVDLGGDLPPAFGHFNSAYAYPGDESILLTSWTLCRLRADDGQIFTCSSNQPDTEPAPLNRLVKYDLGNGVQTVLDDGAEGQLFADVVVMDPRQRPGFSSSELDSTLQDDGLAFLHIRSVYDFDGQARENAGQNADAIDITALADPGITTSATQRPARFLRLIKAASIPENFDNNAAFGSAGAARGMREILGYAPIEPDGSVKVKVPADIAFYFEVVDVNGERIFPTHRNLLHLAGGETYNCHGCHTTGSDDPHGRTNAQAPSANIGALMANVPFPNTEPPNVSVGDTMAEVAINSGVFDGDLTTGLVYTDYWTDADDAGRAKDADYNLIYRGDVNFAAVTTERPATEACQTSWSTLCRTIINYDDHIQRLWDEADRGANTCTNCHSERDTDGLAQTPEAQLILTRSYDNIAQDDENYYTSYVELFRRNVPPPQIENPDQSGFLQLYIYDDDAEGNPQFYPDIVDSNDDPFQIRRIRVAPGDAAFGDLRVASFDGDGNPIVFTDANGMDVTDADNNTFPVTIPVSDLIDPPNQRVFTPGNAANSRFFDEMVDASNSVDHSTFMSPNELRLLREWLDMGGQYYNDPTIP